MDNVDLSVSVKGLSRFEMSTCHVTQEKIEFFLKTEKNIYNTIE